MAIVENSPKPVYNSKIIVYISFKKENSFTPKERFLNLIDEATYQKWYVNITIVVDKEFIFKYIALIDIGANLNCLKEGLVPKKVF